MKFFFQAHLAQFLKAEAQAYLGLSRFRAIFEFLKNVKVRTGMLVDYNLGMGDLILMGVQHGAPRGGR